MRATIIIVLIILTLVSCQKDRKREVVIISELNKLLEDKIKIKNLFYYKHNFILTKDNRIYYFVNNHLFTGDCNSLENSKPEFLRILPIDLKEIQLDSLKPRLEAIISNRTNRLEMVSISSEEDTIKNLALPLFIDFAKGHHTDTQRIGYNYRIMTEEERVVLDAKRKNVIYDPDNVTWKSDFSKIKFNVPNDKIKK